MEMIEMVMGRRMLEWFGHVKRRDETENIRAVCVAGKCLRGRSELRWKYTLVMDLKDWNS